MKPAFYVLKESANSWKENDAISHASSLAYFTMFSIAPLLIIVSAVVGLVFSDAAAEGAIVAAIEDMVGTDIAVFIEELIKSASLNASSGIAAAIGAVVMLYGASLLFYRLELALHAMWNLVPIEIDIQKSAISIVKSRGLSAVAALALGVYVLIALIASALWTLVPQQILEYFFAGIDNTVVSIISFVASPAMYMIPFAVIYKMLPRARVRWRDVWLGAALAAILFWIGGFFIGLYIAYSGFTSFYGAAGSLVAFLLWVFYSAAVFLFGATFIKAYAASYGEPVEPYEGMIFYPNHLEMIELLRINVNDEATEPILVEQNEKSGSE